jgi:two-component system sensor histidine kinase YesM
MYGADQLKTDTSAFREGEIIINVFRREDDLYFTVSDNGLGMTKEQVESLFTGQAGSTSKKGSGIGVKNVNERIKLYFGEAYGLIISSEPDEGTTITIHLPATAYGSVSEKEKRI